MPVLLDTHAFLWWCDDSPELSLAARNAMERNDCFVSMATFWEIAIKVSLGKLRLPGPIEKYLADQMQLNGFERMEIGFRHCVRVGKLTWAHRDPFDRLLASQALEERIPIVSRDPIFTQYGLERIW